MPGGSHRLISDATPRALTRPGFDNAPDAMLHELGQLVTSPETQLEYRVERFLGSSSSTKRSSGGSFELEHCAEHVQADAARELLERHHAVRQEDEH